MPDRKCPHCGNLVPEGSKFCNLCGTQLSNAIECPACHNAIPADSIFCPVCREMVKKKRPTPPVPTYAPGTRPATTPKQAPNAWATPAEMPEEQEPETDNNGKKSKWRTGIVIAAIVAFIGLIVVTRCFYNSDKNDGNEGDGNLTENMANNTFATTDIFNRTLDANNLKVDGDRIAYAIRLTDDKGNLGDQIIGVTYLSDEMHSFYKIYTLNKNGNNWDIKLNQTKYLNGRELKFNPEELRCDEIPMVENINGKKYFLFGYANLPRTAIDSSGIFTVAIFDIEQGQIAEQIDYNGVRVRNSQGQEQIISRTNSNKNGILATHLKDFAQNIEYLHIPTQQEIDAENRARAEEEAARLRADSIANANLMEAEQIAQQDFENGEAVKVDVQAKDKSQPQFRADEFSKKINGPDYNVFLLKDGRIFAFNKSTNSTFQVNYRSQSANDIGWKDSASGILSIRTSSGNRVLFDLQNHTVKKAE